MSKRNPLSDQCTATATGSGERCRQRVIGGGVCRKHGGAAPQVRRARLERIALAEAVAQVAVDSSPGDVLLHAVATAKALLDRMIATTTEGPVTVRQMRHLVDALDRSARVAESAVRNGLDDKWQAKQSRDVLARDATSIQRLIEATLWWVGVDPASDEARAAFVHGIDLVSSEGDAHLVHLAELHKVQALSRSRSAAHDANTAALSAEVTRLTATVAEVTEERDRLRQALARQSRGRVLELPPAAADRRSAAEQLLGRGGLAAVVERFGPGGAA